MSSYPRAVLARTLILGLILTCAAAFPERRSSACAVVVRDATPALVGEEAIIVWDEATHTEHFIRTAAFRGASVDFGFIVPTPTRPTIAETDAAVFDRVFDLYRVPPPPEPPEPRSRGRFRSGDAMPSSMAVTVVERAEVAGLEATVLLASSASALDEWMRTNGYRSSPELARWLERYVAAGYHVTAFRVAGSESQANREQSTRLMRALRMTFTTERPFFPYSEPQLQGRTGRPFRVSVAATTRVRALLGSAPWQVPVGYARRSPRVARALGSAVPALPRGPLWLTTYNEWSSVRGTEDLYFERDPSRRAVASTIDERLLPSVQSGLGLIL